MICHINSSHKIQHSKHEKKKVLHCHDFHTTGVDEICLITGVIEYTNGIYFHCFHGGIFLPHSG